MKWILYDKSVSTENHKGHMKEKMPSSDRFGHGLSLHSDNDKNIFLQIIRNVETTSVSGKLWTNLSVLRQGTRKKINLMLL